MPNITCNAVFNFDMKKIKNKIKPPSTLLLLYSGINSFGFKLAHLIYYIIKDYHNVSCFFITGAT